MNYNLIILAIRLADRVEEELSENFGSADGTCVLEREPEMQSTNEKPDPGTETEVEKKCDRTPIKIVHLSCQQLLFQSPVPIYFKKVKQLYKCHNELATVNSCALNKS